jgi:hypothetical protein
VAYQPPSFICSIDLVSIRFPHFTAFSKQQANRSLILAQNCLMLTHLLLHYWNIKLHDMILNRVQQHPCHLVDLLWCVHSTTLTSTTKPLSTPSHWWFWANLNIHFPSMIENNDSVCIIQGKAQCCHCCHLKIARKQQPASGCQFSANFKQ